MVAAPLSTVDLPTTLPTSTATPQKKPDKPIYVSVKPDLSLAIQEEPVKRIDLFVHSMRCGCQQGSRIFIRADRSVPYGEFFGLMEMLRAGGYTKVKLVALERAPDTAVPAPATAQRPERLMIASESNEQKSSLRLGLCRSGCARASCRWRRAGDRAFAGG